jgi:hypothetical protein
MESLLQLFGSIVVLTYHCLTGLSSTDIYRCCPDLRRWSIFSGMS